MWNTPEQRAVLSINEWKSPSSSSDRRRWGESALAHQTNSRPCAHARDKKNMYATNTLTAPQSQIPRKKNSIELFLYNNFDRFVFLNFYLISSASHWFFSSSVTVIMVVMSVFHFSPSSIHHCAARASLFFPNKRDKHLSVPCRFLSLSVFYEEYVWVRGVLCVHFRCACSW